MTHIATLKTPGNFILIVVAHAAKFPIYDSRHGYIISTRLHLKAVGIVAHITGKSNAVKPVRIYHWPHPCVLGSFVDNYISILSLRRGRGDHCKQHQQNWRLFRYY